jgi:hypothetical protein
MTYYPSFVSRSGQVPMDTPAAPGETVDGAIVDLRGDVADADRATGTAQATADQALGLGGAAFTRAAEADQQAGQALTTANQALVLAQAEGNVYPTTAAAQADANFPAGGYYYVPNPTTGGLDLWRKVDANSSTFQLSLPGVATVQANAAAVATLSEQVSALAFTVHPPGPTDPYGEVFTTITSPDTRWTVTITGGALTIAQNQAAILGRGLQHLTTTLVAGLVIEAEFAASALTLNTGFYLTFNSSTVFDPTHGRLIGVRANGAVQALWGDATTATGTGITLTNLPSVPFVAGDILVLRLVVAQNDPTAGTLYFLRGGETVGSVPVTGLPTGAQFVGAFVRQIGPATQATAAIRRFQSHPVARDQIRWRSINIAGVGTDVGTESNPFLSLQSAVRDFSDHPGRSARLTLKGGVYRFPIVVALKSWRELTIRAEKGADVAIHGSTLLTSGWTKTAGATNVWQRPTVADGSSAGSNVGGFVDLGTPTDLSAYDAARNQSPTPRAGQTMPWTIYQRLTPYTGITPTLATQLALCDITPGSMFNDATVAATTYVHCLGHADPNTRQLESADRTSALRVAWAAAGDWNDCRVNLVGLHLKFAYNHVLWLQRCQVQIEECVAEGATVGNSMNLDACGGRVEGSECRWSFNDGIHSDAVDLATNILRPKVAMFDCLTHHHLLGDGVSNHEGTEHIGYSVRSNYNGKSGFAQIDQTRLLGCQMKGNIIGFNTGSQTLQQTIYMDLVDCDIDGCVQGLAAGVNQVGSKAVVTVRGGRMARTGVNAAPASNNAATIGPETGGPSTLAITGMRDDGGNGSIGTGVACDGRPGDLGVPRADVAANIALASARVNTGGKSTGRQVWDTTNSRIMVATGPLPGDAWKSDGGATTVAPV